MGSVSGKWGEISETLERRSVDICCVQEVRWKGQGAAMIGNGFKFLWGGSSKAVNGVGVVVANWLIGKIVEVERYSDRVMKVNIVIGDVVWEVVSCYCPQAGRSINEKEEFYELMGKVVTSDCVLLVGGDFNGHFGSDMSGFGEVHGGFEIGQINDGGIRLLDWTVGKGLHLMNTCFQKRKSQPVTFGSGETETMIDYILVNNKYRSSVKDVKGIPGEEIVSQHCLLLMDMVFKKKVKRKVKFRKKLKLWRLRESELRDEFADGFNNKCDGNEDCYDLKSKLLDVASEVCGYTKGKPRHFETWWWNKDLDVAVRRKRELFRIWRQSQNEEDRKKDCKAEEDAKRVVYVAMDQKAREAVEKVDSSRDGCELFRIAKQRAGEKSDVVGVSCLKDESGVVKVSMDDRKKIWKEHMEKFVNVENEWSDSIDASKVEGAVRRTEVEEVRCAMNQMKIGKASRPSGVAQEMF